MSEAVEEYAKEYVREKQAVNVKNIMEDTGFTVEQALDEADLLAENSNERMTHEEVYRALKSRVTIPFTLHGIEEMLTVEYKQGTDPREIGYDALQGFPIDKICCTGYPVMYGYFEHMNATGYRRSCGFIQFVERIENHGENRELSIDVSDDNLEKGNPYFAYGYPAEIFDAPCCNLAGCRHLKWTAYTYLVDLPSRMNGNKLKFLGGYSWGYEEDENGPQRLLPLEILTENDWEKHATEKGILKISQITGGCTAKL